MADKTAELRNLIKAWNAALERKDLDAMFANYLPDATLFDCKPPYILRGVKEIRGCWEQCLPFFPEKFKTELHDEKLIVEGDMAYLSGLHHMTIPDEPDHPCGQTWLRISVVYLYRAGRWMVAHEHVSAPFNPMTNQVAMIKDPKDLMCGVVYPGCDCK